MQTRVVFKGNAGEGEREPGWKGRVETGKHGVASSAARRTRETRLARRIGAR